MVQLTRIYTRGGDKGKTSLATGKRVPKHDLRVQTYGTVDETNAAIGLARLHTRASVEADGMLARIQNDLFDLGADLCTPAASSDSAGPALRVVAAQVERLEREIDSLNASLPPLASFILPGGTAAAAHLHQARTICRRTERLLTELMGVEPDGINPAVLQYLNRLSDHLFVLARHVNDHGMADVLWIPGDNTREP